MFRRRKNDETPAGNVRPPGEQPPSGEVRFSAAWGGWYTQQSEDGSWTVFRLLDINRDAYHSTLFRDRFSERPTFEQAIGLQPYALHVPIAAGRLVHYPATLIGATPLQLEDLYGYDVYLEQAAGMPDPDRRVFLQKLVGFSTQPPLDFRMGFAPDGEFTIAQA